MMITPELIAELDDVLVKLGEAAEHPERVTHIQHPEYQSLGHTLVRNTIEVVVHPARDPRPRV
jgi:hypothetical protein